MKANLVNTLLKARTTGFQELDESAKGELRAANLISQRGITEFASTLMDATTWWRDGNNVKNLIHCVGGRYIAIQNNTVIDYDRDAALLYQRHQQERCTMLWVPKIMNYG